MKLDKQKTYTKRIAAGIICKEPFFQVTKDGDPVTADDLEEYKVYVPSDGKKGGTRRVWRTFPRLMPRWEVSCSMYVTDDVITEDVLVRHLRCAGTHDGLGSMRIGNNGPNGMWTLERIELREYDLANL